MPCPPISVQDSYSQLRILQPNTNNIQPTTALQDPYSLKVLNKLNFLNTNEQI